MLRSLPPVGNPLTLEPSAQPETVFQEAFGDRSVFLYGSGTMALAAAFIAARKSAQAQRQIVSPEVLLPAYACPDLVSAALFAGLKPVLVDLQAETPWMNLDILKESLNPNTVAVVAVHFLGIPDRLQAIRSILESTNTLLIEDSAQLFPAKFTDDVWQGDLVTLSFGRGKPVSLLGGGAVLGRNSALLEHLPLAQEAALQQKAKPGGPTPFYALKARLYNMLLSPGFYGLLQYVPFLHIGETIYKPLQGITPFNREKIGILAANIAVYSKREREAQSWIRAMLQEIGGDHLIDLTGTQVAHQLPPLLRYPLLAKKPQLQKRLSQNLAQNGLGVSNMYPCPLPEISGIENEFPEQGEFPEARLFSQRLLTLPCHSGVRKSDIAAMKKVIEETIESLE